MHFRRGKESGTISPNIELLLYTGFIKKIELSVGFYYVDNELLIFANRIFLLRIRMRPEFPDTFSPRLIKEYTINELVIVRKKNDWLRFHKKIISNKYNDKIGS